MGLEEGRETDENPYLSMPMALAMASTVPTPQKGSSTCRTLATSRRNVKPMYAASRPMPLGHSISPRSNTSGAANALVGYLKVKVGSRISNDVNVKRGVRRGIYRW